MLLIVAFNNTDCNTDFNPNQMKNKKPYLNFYKKYYGKLLPDCGLCYSLSKEFNQYANHWLWGWAPISHTPMDIFNDEENCNPYYGYNGKSKSDAVMRSEFTTLRQNMVLLLAAMNGEL